MSTVAAAAAVVSCWQRSSFDQLLLDKGHNKSMKPMTWLEQRALRALPGTIHLQQSNVTETPGFEQLHALQSVCRTEQPYLSIHQRSTAR